MEQSKKIMNFYPVEAMTLDRVKLRMIEIKDALGIFNIRSNLEMIRFTGIPQMNRMEEAEIFIDSRLDGMKKGKWIYLIIADIKTDELMGTVCLFNFDEKCERCDIGYELLPIYQGNGYVHESIIALTDYGFKIIGVDNIFADINIKNQTSINVVEKAGFNFDKDLENGFKLYRINCDNMMQI